MKTLLTVLILSMSVSLGCGSRGRSDFHVSVSNRTNNTILFYANGVEQGQVGAGRAQAFVVVLETLDSYYSGPSETAQATFAARDVVTGKLSRERRMTLMQDRPENIEFNPYDFQ